MTTQEEFLAAPATDVPREGGRWNRPLIIPPGGKPGDKLVPYTRTTTYVDCLDDTYNLRRWEERNTALGLAIRNDLLLRAASLGMPPLDPEAEKRWKSEMNDVVKQAKDAAASSASATIGTSLHAYTERIDRGEHIDFIPPQYADHLDNYRRATALFEHTAIERFVVNDELKIGGTPDRVAKIKGHDGLFILDVKTGTVEYGTLKMAMQLAVYSRSAFYNSVTGERTSMGPVNQDRGVIIALNAKTGECKCLWIDLAAGWEAVQVATTVRAWRRRKDLTKNVDLPALNAEAAVVEGLGGEVLPMSPSDKVEALRAAVLLAENPDELATLWRAAGDVWTPELTELARVRKAALLLTGEAA